jgi:hypothetical protein
MSEHGGRREGAGRPRGSKNPNTKARHAAIKAIVAKVEPTIENAFDGDAVSFMQLIYRDPSQDISVRLDAARHAARYERPTLTAVAVRDVSPQPSGPGATSERIAELLERGLARGVTLVARTIADGAGGAEPVGEA